MQIISIHKICYIKENLYIKIILLMKQSIKGKKLKGKLICTVISSLLLCTKLIKVVNILPHTKYDL